MKKKFILLLALAVCTLACAAALAEDVSGKGTLAIQNDGLAAYVDGSGNLMIPGNDEPINELEADAVISIDSYHLVFLSTTDEGTDDEQTALVSIDLSTFEESVVDSNVYAACMIDTDQLYFISASDRTQLYLADFTDNLVSVVYTSEEYMDCLYESADGLVVTFVEDAGAVVYVSATDSFEPYGESIPAKSEMTDDYQIYLSDDDTLYVSDGATDDAIDTNVFDFETMDEKIYYLTSADDVLQIRCYDPDSEETTVISTPDTSLETQIAATETQIFVLGIDHVVYSVDLDTGALESFLTITAPEVDDDTYVDSYTIEGVNGLLIVYANLAEVEETPTFTFMEFTTDVEDTTEVILGETVEIDDETLAWTLLQPAEQYTTLSRGSRGDAVSAIQQPLYDHGYYDYYIDGIFGYRTELAIKLLQEDLGLTVDGIADEELQEIILSGDIPDYDPYAQLDRGDRGLRVQWMQQRLRDLGYLADSADGIFGPKTQAAVQLFQEENGLTVSESATSETLVLLYSSSASKCSSYISLQIGDSGYRVRELNKRLKELYYMDGAVGDTYTTATAEAVRLFQAQVGLTIDGTASVTVQEKLFSSSAPEYSGYTVLRRGDEGSRVARLQRRLKELNYFSGSITGYYGSKTQAAVKLFQQTVGIRPTGTATIRTQELLFSPYAIAYVEPTEIGTPVISIDAFDSISDGIYYLSDASSDNGYVTFSWSAEGDVDYYNVTITDTNGNVLLNQDTMLTMTGVSISTLTKDLVYTLYVTAYPADDGASTTTNSLSFCRTDVPEEDDDAIGTITDVSASVSPYTYYEDYVYYVRADSITLYWYAEGDVDSYYIEIRSSDATLISSASTTDEQASLSTDTLEEGEIYTLYVYAIPTNGTEDDARIATVSFALDTTTDDIPTVDAPNVTVDGVTADSDGSYTVDGDEVNLIWDAVEDASQYYIEVLDSNGVSYFTDTTTATEYALTTGSLTEGYSYTVYVTAIPTGGTIEDGSTASIVINLTAQETITQLDAPTLSITNAAYSSDGVYYLDGSELALEWTEVDGAAGYNIVIRDSNNSVYSEETTTELSVTYDISELVYDAVYSVSVTAVPEDGVDAQGTAATLKFIIESEDSESELATASDDPLTSEATASPTATAEPIPTEVPAATEEPIETEEPEESSETAEAEEETEAEEEAEAEEETETEEETEAEASSYDVGTPVITISPAEEVVNDITYVEDGIITFTWYAEGNLSGYYAEIYDEDGNLCTEMETESEGASLDSSNLVAESVYTIRITAIPADGTVEDGVSAEAYFAKHSTEEAESEEESDESSEEATEESEEIAEEESVSISAPVITIDPVVEEIDSISYIEEGSIALSWYAEGDVGSYYLEILDGDTVLASMETESTTANLSTNNMASDTIYILRITAIPVGGTAEEGVSAEVYFALAVEESAEATEETTEETTDEATEETTDEATEEPTEEPTAEPTEEPTEEPTAEPTEEPTEEPTAEPTEEPVEESIAEITSLTVSIDPIVEEVDSIVYIENGSVTLSWSADGDVDSYYLEILDGDTVLASIETEDTSTSMSTSNMSSGTVYILRITAIPTGGTLDDGVSSELSFALAVQETAEPTEEPTAEPTEEPTAEPTEEPTAEPTEEPTAEPTEEPTAEPTEEPTAEPTEEPSATEIPDETWSTPLDAESDPTLIAAVQERLVELEWLTEETYTIGELDEATITAVLAFQNDYNLNYDGTLVLITYEEPVIEAETLTLLMIEEE